MTTGGTDAIQMLISDHRKVEQLFQQYRQADGQGHQKTTVARQLLSELEAHSKIEEEIFYPAVRARADQQLQQAVSEGYEEHATVDNLVMELKAMDPSDSRFDAKMQELMRDVQHHVQEEETELLPDARQKLGDQVTQLAPQMMERKQQILSQSGMGSGSTR